MRSQIRAITPLNKDRPFLSTIGETASTDKAESSESTAPISTEEKEKSNSLDTGSNSDSDKLLGVLSGPPVEDISFDNQGRKVSVLLTAIVYVKKNKSFDIECTNNRKEAGTRKDTTLRACVGAASTVRPKSFSL